MDILSAIAFIFHVIAALLLLSTIPHQLSTIIHESDKRFRGICWIMFIGTFCLVLMNILPLLSPLFYENMSGVFFTKIVGLFNALVTIILATLTHVLYSVTQKAAPRIVDELEKKL